MFSESGHLSPTLFLAPPSSMSNPTSDVKTSEASDTKDVDILDHPAANVTFTLKEERRLRLKFDVCVSAHIIQIRLA